MNCLKKKEIIAFIDKELSTARLEKIASHLDGCSKCKEEVKKFQMDIRLVKEHLDVLNPVEVVEKPMTAPAAIQGSGRRKPSWKEWFAASIRVPVPVMALFFIVILFMAVVLLLQQQKISQLKSPLWTAKQKTALYVIDGHSHQIDTQLVDIRLEGFQPVVNPRVYKSKEVQQ